MLKRIRAFDVVNYTIFIILSIVMIYPFWHTIVGSIMRYEEYLQKSFILFTTKPSLDAYVEIFKNGRIVRPYINTIFITLVGTTLSLFCTSYTAYGLSRKFLGQKLAMSILVISMFINVGLIPNYLLFKKLDIINTYSVYFLPGLIVPFYIIILRSSFMDFENGILESARIDGCTEFGLFFKMVLPLSKAVLAAIGLFLAVGYWNTLNASLFFITDSNKKSLQEYLYRMITDTTLDGQAASAENVATQTVKLANITAVVLPILLVYPFLQKYFIKGAMIGAIKG